jgi:hypothetical protein
MNLLLISDEGGVQNICYSTLIKQFNKQLFREWLTRDLYVKMNSNDIRSKFGISF